MRLTDKPEAPKLTIELVPKTCWWSNVRSNISAADWEKCKKFVQKRSGNRCEICGGRGPKWPVECHEVWDYVAVNEDGKPMEVGDWSKETHYVQVLVDLVALCPNCHEVKHIGRAIASGTGDRAIEHLARVNGITIEEAEQMAIDAYGLWEERSKRKYRLDVSFLTLLGIQVPEKMDRAS